MRILSQRVCLLPRIIGCFAFIFAGVTHAEERFTSAISDDGRNFGSGSVTVNHDLAGPALEDLQARMNSLETELANTQNELEATTAALEGDVERLDELVETAQFRADEAWDHAEAAHNRFTDITDALDARLTQAEKDIVANMATTLNELSKRATKAYAEATRGTANTALYDAGVAYRKAVEAYNHASSAHSQLVNVRSRLSALEAGGGMPPRSIATASCSSSNLGDYGYGVKSKDPDRHDGSIATSILRYECRNAAFGVRWYEVGPW